MTNIFFLSLRSGKTLFIEMQYTLFELLSLKKLSNKAILVMEVKFEGNEYVNAGEVLIDCYSIETIKKVGELKNG